MKEWRHGQADAKDHSGARHVTASKEHTLRLTSAHGVVLLSSVTLVILVTLLAVRLPLFLDEAVSLNEARQPGWRNVVRVIQAWDRGKPPLYFLILHFWLTLFPATEVSLRTPSIIFAGLSIPVLFVIGKDIVGRKAAALACALLAINPQFVLVSSWARMYSLFFLLTLSSSLCLVRAIRSRTRGPADAWYLVSVAALLYVHNFSLLVICMHWTYVLLFHRGRFLRVVWLTVMAGTLYLPWAWIAYHQLASILQPGSPISWIPSPTALNLLGVFKHLAGSELLAMLFVPVSAFTVITCIGGIRAKGFKEDGAWSQRVAGVGLAVSWMVVPVALVFGFSWTARPIYVFHYVLFILPGFLWLVAAGAVELDRRGGRVVVPVFAGAAVVLSGVSIVGIMQDEARPDWRTMAQYVVSRRSEGDIVVVDIGDPAHRLAYAYYDRASEVFGIRAGFHEKQSWRTRRAVLGGEPGWVWVVAKRGAAEGPGGSRGVEFGSYGVYRLSRSSLAVNGEALDGGFP